MAKYLPIRQQEHLYQSMRNRYPAWKKVADLIGGLSQSIDPDTLSAIDITGLP